MTTIEELLEMNLDQQFEDWGRPAIYRQVSAHFTPELQHNSEEHHDHPVTVIMGTQPTSISSSNETGHLVETVTLCMKAESMPAESPNETDRIVIDAVEFEIHETIQTGCIVALTCHRCG